MYVEGDWLLLWKSDWSPLGPGAQQSLPWSGAFWWKTPSQSSSMHVYVSLHRELGVNPGRSDQLALAESGLLTLDPCWVVLPINPSGLSWSWCSVLSSGSSKHTGTITLQLPLSVSLGVSSVLLLTSGHSDLLVSYDIEALALMTDFGLACPLIKIALTRNLVFII